MAVHGILRLGACYCPMDSDSWSQARIRATLDAVGSDMIVSTTKDDIPGYQVTYVGDILQTTSDSMASGKIQETLEYLQQVRRQLRNCDLVYIIFTSGTTGTPKGVMVPHSSLAHLVQQDYPGSLTVYPGVKILLLFSVAFDGCAGIIMTTLCNGGTLAMATSNDYAEISKACSTLIVTPSILATLDPTEGYDRVREIYMGGESPNAALINAWIKPNRKVYNSYGPSECTTAVSVAEMSPGGPIILGTLVSGVNIVLLDENLEEVEMGEICISGPSLAVGYLNNEALTAEKFFMWKGVRHYRTGDLARRTKHGLEFAGRVDRLVKNRGFLVNLETEVEPALLGFSGVCSATAFLYHSKLVAFVTPKSIPAQELRQDLKRKHDPFVVPDLVFPLETLPLTANGKVDKKRLEEILHEMDTAIGGSYEDSPIVLANFDIVKKGLAFALDMAPEAINNFSSFGEMGGTSLSAVKFIAFLRRHGLSISLGQVFTLDRVADICLSTKPIDPLDQNTKETPGQLVSGTGVPMTDQQVLLNMETAANPIANCLVFSLTSCDPGRVPDVAQLHAAWKQLFQRHSIFRTTFDLESKHQIVRSESELNWSEIVVPESDFVSRCDVENKLIWKKLRIPRVDLSNPLNFFKIIITPGRLLRLFWVIHHSLFDGWSLGIVLEELRALMNGTRLLPAPTFEGAARFQQHINTRDRSISRSFWDEYLKCHNYLRSVNLPPTSITKDDWAILEPPVNLMKRKLDGFSCTQRVSSSSIIYAAWSLVLQKYTASNTVGFKISLSGRTLPWPSTESVVGPLNNRCAFVTQIDPSMTRSVFLRAIHQNFYQVSDYQWSYNNAIEHIIPGEEAKKDLFCSDVHVLFDMPVNPGPWKLREVQMPITPLGLGLVQKGEDIAMRLRYDGKRFSDTGVASMATDFITVLHGLVFLPSPSVRDICALIA